MSRREFLERLGWGGMGLGTVGLLAALGRFLLPNVEAEEPTRATAGPPGDFVLGQATFLRENRTWLRRDAAGFYALSATCTHLGCTVRWEKDRFLCPCHGSEYDAAGQPCQGPATRPLLSVLVGLNAEGQLVVDRAKTALVGFRLAV